MNARISKKLRKLNRRAWRGFFDDIASLSFRNRLGIAWYIITNHKEVK